MCYNISAFIYPCLLILNYSSPYFSWRVSHENASDSDRLWYNLFMVMHFLFYMISKHPLKISANSCTEGGGNLVSSMCVVFESKQTLHVFGYEAEENYSNLAPDYKQRIGDSR